MWVRNTKEKHGDVLNDCTFEGLGDCAVIARFPDNKGKNYPDAECVLLNCTLDGISSEEFGPVDASASIAKLYEFNSRDKTEKTIDVSKKINVVRQLNGVKDAEFIDKYSHASWVLK